LPMRITVSADATGLIDAFEFVMRYSPFGLWRLAVSMSSNWIIGETMSTAFPVHNVKEKGA